jgi:hypothetical protein
MILRDEIVDFSKHAVSLELYWRYIVDETVKDGPNIDRRQSRNSWYDVLFMS